MKKSEKIAEEARKHKMSPAEKREQRIGLVLGAKSHQSNLSRDQVATFMDKIEGRSERDKSRSA